MTTVRLQLLETYWTLAPMSLISSQSTVLFKQFVPVQEGRSVQGCTVYCTLYTVYCTVYCTLSLPVVQPCSVPLYILYDAYKAPAHRCAPVTALHTIVYCTAHYYNLTALYTIQHNTLLHIKLHYTLLHATAYCTAYYPALHTELHITPLHSALHTSQFHTSL